MEEEDWYFLDSDAQQKGPFPIAHLASLYQKSTISDATYVWCPSMDAWQPISQRVDVQTRCKQAAPSSNRAQNRRRSATTEDLDDIRAAMHAREAATAAVTVVPVRRANSFDHKKNDKIPVSELVVITEPCIFNSIKLSLRGFLKHRPKPDSLVQKGILTDDRHLKADTPRVRSSPKLPFFKKGGSSGKAVVAEPEPSNPLYATPYHTVVTNHKLNGAGIPVCIWHMMEALKPQLATEGIFRVPGDGVEVKELRKSFDWDADSAEQHLKACDNPHSIAGVFKLFFRALPEPLLMFELYEQWIEASAGASSGAKNLAPVLQLLTQIPPPNLSLLAALVEFLTVVSSTDGNKMTVGNTAVVFAPNLLRPREENLTHLKDVPHTVGLLQIFIEHRNTLFSS